MIDPLERDMQLYPTPTPSVLSPGAGADCTGDPRLFRRQRQADRHRAALRAASGSVILREAGLEAGGGARAGILSGHPHEDPDYPLVPPVGRNGRPETARQSFSIDAVNEFDPIFEDMYDYCEAQELEVDTLIHESGAAQMEINFLHGDAIDLADQVFLFKRTMREAAHKHGIYATFMAKPMSDEPGSAMHIHQSLEDANGRNLFGTDNGGNSEQFMHFIAGLQKYTPAVTALLAPNVNSYRRLTFR